MSSYLFIKFEYFFLGRISHGKCQHDFRAPDCTVAQIATKNEYFIFLKIKTNFSIEHWCVHLCLIQNDSCVKTWENVQLQNGNHLFRVHRRLSFELLHFFSSWRWHLKRGSSPLARAMAVLPFCSRLTPEICVQMWCKYKNQKGKKSKNYGLIIDHACESSTSLLSLFLKYLFFNSLLLNKNRLPYDLRIMSILLFTMKYVVVATKKKLRETNEIKTNLNVKYRNRTAEWLI